MSGLDRYALLSVISRQKLPATYSDTFQVDMIRSYIAADLVVATIVEKPGGPPLACVSAVTRRGMQAIHAQQVKIRGKRG